MEVERIGLKKKEEKNYKFGRANVRILSGVGVVVVVVGSEATMSPKTEIPSKVIIIKRWIPRTEQNKRKKNHCVVSSIVNCCVL